MCYVVLCLVMLVADLHYRYLEMVRHTLSVVTYPLQVIAAAPADLARSASTYFGTLVSVQAENADLRRKEVQQAQQLLRFAQVERENQELRDLLGMAQSVQSRSVAAEILYDAPDPFSRKVILNRGASDGIEPGFAVLDAAGVIGQATRAYPAQTEVTLLTDKDQAIAVKVARNGLRGVLFGNGDGSLELRFMPVGSDVEAGDELITSGLDGIFVPNLPVAQVTAVTPADAFLRIQCEPLGHVERATQVLVLGRAEPAPPLPDPDSAIEPPLEQLVPRPIETAATSDSARNKDAAKDKDKNKDKTKGKDSAKGKDKEKEKDKDKDSAAKKEAEANAASEGAQAAAPDAAQDKSKDKEKDKPKDKDKPKEKGKKAADGKKPAADAKKPAAKPDADAADR